MKLVQLIFYGLFIGALTSVNGQTPLDFSQSFTEQTSPEEKFAIYLDTLNKYLYRDINISNIAIQECEKIIDQNIPLSDSIFFKFILEKIYFKHNMADPLGAYRVIVENQNQIDQFKISNSNRGAFNYIKGFTYMAIGDLDEAQNIYYQNLEKATFLKDTSTIISSLYSLGQLYTDQKDHFSAIQSYEKTLEYSKHIKIRPSTLTLIYLEKAQSLRALKQQDEALEALDIAYQIASDGKLEILKTEVLIQKGNYTLEKGDEKKAEEIYQQIVANHKNIQDQNNKIYINRFLAELYRVQKKYQLSLATQHKVLEQLDTTNYDRVMDAYDQLQQISFEMQDYQSAHGYLLTYNKIKEKRDQDLKKQKTDYLKIKFETGEKEKQNVILAAQIVESKNESKILFLWLAISGLAILLMFVAFYQKNKYSKKLEAEVSKRTINLKQSNKALSKFNRILSHDLKEPIRSIVGFSQLALRPDKTPEEKEEYLEFVISSGQQLQNLINSISCFQLIDTSDFSDLRMLNIEGLLEKMTNHFQKIYPSKKIELKINISKSIYLPEKAFTTILGIVLKNSILFNKNKIVKVGIDYSLVNNFHRFTIQDNGIGIDQEYHGRIFEMFQRLNNRNTYQGSGLGLSIAKKMLTKLNGSITLLDSQKEVGSTFLIQVPMLKQTTSSATFKLELEKNS